MIVARMTDLARYRHRTIGYPRCTLSKVSSQTNQLILWHPLAKFPLLHNRCYWNRQVPGTWLHILSLQELHGKETWKWCVVHYFNLCFNQSTQVYG